MRDPYKQNIDVHYKNAQLSLLTQVEQILSFVLSYTRARCRATVDTQQHENANERADNDR